MTERTHLAISSSIENFRSRLLARCGAPSGIDLLSGEDVIWGLWKSKGFFTVFWGLYHPFDYLKFIFHRGERGVFWCGGDIVNLKKRRFWSEVIRRVPAHHLCENELEQKALAEMGIQADIKPMFFGDVTQFAISFKPSKNPQVYIHCPPGREEEYGLIEAISVAHHIPEVTFHFYGTKFLTAMTNIVSHGMVSERQFNEEVKEYHCALRLNEFDGFADITAKSILLGQYPITRIPYPNIDCAPDKEALLKLLKELKYKKRPNYKAREFWYEKLRP